MRSATFRQQLWSMILVVLVLLLTLAVSGWWGIHRVSQNLDHLYAQSVRPAEGLLRTLDGMHRIRAQALLAVTEETEAAASAALAELPALDQALAAHWQPVNTRFDDPDLRAAGNRFDQHWAAYLKARDQSVLMIEVGDLSSALHNMKFNAGKPFQQADESLQAIIRRQGDLAKSYQQAANRIQQWSERGQIALGFLGLTLFAVIAVALFRGTMRQLGGEPALAARLARLIAEGKLDNEIPLKTGDTSSLLASMRDMQHQLHDRIHAERRSAAESLRIQSALDKASTNMMVADAAGTLIYLNEAFDRMMREAEADIRQAVPGFSATGLLGRGFADFHQNPAHQQGLLEGLKGTYISQMRVGGRTFKLIANPVLDAQGIRLGTVVEWIDRTAEVAAEAELDTLLEAVAHGDFSQRLGIDGKAGFFRDLAEGMNNLTEIVSKALDDLAIVLKAVAQADLTKKIESRYKGRFADLKNDTNATVEQLERLVGRITEATDAINTAAAEIAAGNTDLSERTEEQASSLEETASSMEEFNASIQQNAQNAGSAQQLARLANDRAAAGGVLVRRLVETMGGIQESSQRIADIIGVIDSIAFQTNILALNAAVEAARAGEQGRGFAVVAAEVRTLAQRSAQAAKEIKGLIDASVSTVNEGAGLASETGATMEAIVSSFQQVVTLVSEIAEASREQGAGIGQVTQAIAQMDDTTQRNAALVEEAAAAAESLEDQAQALIQTVAVFKTHGLHQGHDAHGGGAADDIDFDEFVYVHKQWSKKLRRVVEGRSEPQDPTVVSCDDKCGLGEWIHGAGRRFKTVPVYEALRTRHAQFHQCAGDVLRHAIVGERELADRALSGRFVPLSNETIEQIRRLEQHCLQGDSMPRVPLPMVK